MALMTTNTMFKPHPAKSVYQQKVTVRPVEHHYEDEGGRTKNKIFLSNM